MRFTTTNDVLANVLSMVGGAIIKKTPTPILTGVKIEVQGDQAIVESFNYSGERRQIAFRVDKKAEDGVCVVNHERLSAIVGKLSSGNITLALGNNKLTIRSGDYTGTIQTYQIEDWLFSGTDTEEFDGDGFSIDLPKPGLLATVGLAASSDESRPTLTNIMLRVSKEPESLVSDFVLAATDGYRLTTYQQGTVDGDKVEMLIPKVVANGIAKIASVLKQPATLRINEAYSRGQVYFEQAKEPLLWVKLTFSLSTDKFPNYESIVPPDNAATLTMLCSPIGLQGAIDRALTMVEDGNIGRVKLTFTQEKVLVERTTEDGTSTESVSFLTDASAAFEDSPGVSVLMGMSGKYLIEGLSIFDTLVTLRVTQPSRPLKLTNGDWTHVIMPMSL